jgi:hypothetical protein
MPIGLPAGPWSVPDPLGDAWDEMVRRNRRLQAKNDPMGAGAVDVGGVNGAVADQLNGGDLSMKDWQALRARQIGDGTIAGGEGEDALAGGAGGDRVSATLSPADVAAKVVAEAKRQGVDPSLALGIATQESHMGRLKTPSGKGAIGVMQLMPEVAKGLGVDPNDIDDNIKGGVTLFGQLMRRYHGNVDLALAAYNSGPTAVRMAGGVPNIPETQNYVPAVKAYANLYRAPFPDPGFALVGY